MRRNLGGGLDGQVAQVGADNVGVTANLGRCAGGDDPAEVEHRDAPWATEMTTLRRCPMSKLNADAPIGEGGDGRRQLIGVRAIDPGDRFVEEQEGRGPEQGASHGPRPGAALVGQTPPARRAPPPSSKMSSSAPNPTDGRTRPGRTRSWRVDDRRPPSSPRTRFSRTVMSSNNSRDWKVMPIPKSARAAPPGAW